MSPEISIILPTYNGSRFIRKSIDSCLNQTYPNFELIIVNDCSIDDTASILQEYASKDSRIKIITNEKNLKLPLSLNKGFDNASGKYFTWTSDDNYYTPFALEIMYNFLEKNPTTDLVYTNYTLINNSDETTGTRTFNNVYDSFHKWKGCGACFLYKSVVQTELKGYNPSFFLIEDYEFFVRAFVKFKFGYIDRTDLYFYREHAASLTGHFGSSVNDISKIAIERQIPELIKVLPKKEIALLYRKFAVFFAVQKNDIKKTDFFLQKLATESKKQLLTTMLYIPAVKFIKAITVSFSVIAACIPLFFKRSKIK
jgi:glycosyltransferase involved in cell wall biosynthesis